MNAKRKKSAGASRRKSGKKSPPKKPRTSLPEWASVRLSNGATLGDTASDRPVLLVFLRHSG